MKVGTSHLSNGQLPVKRQPCGSVSAGHALVSRSRCSNLVSPCRLPSVASGHHATNLQSPPINAGLPSAVAWSHPTVEGVPSTAEFAEKQAVQRKDTKLRMSACIPICQPPDGAGDFFAKSRHDRAALPHGFGRPAGRLCHHWSFFNGKLSTDCAPIQNQLGT